ncbi:hypothetical protein niasHT_025297 [Heterodera trifolii]|uniref:Protein amnionless n=1 Tax=Heterodera trifolii TaxID=157864 RepID=A0ABD2KAS4_9BILA
MFNVPLFPIFLLFFPCRGTFLFRWLPSNALSDPQNWLPPGSVPCVDDNVRLDSDNDAAVDQKNIVVANLDGPLRDTEFGTALRAPNWQCAKRDRPEDAIFNAHNNEPNFFDFNNWQILSETSAQMPSLLRLDAERVPSEEDRVLFPDDATSKVFIDVPARIKSFNISGQSLTSLDLWHLLQTVEGQFRFRMGERISMAVNSVDKFQYRWPIDTVFTVTDDDEQQIEQPPRKQRAEFFGRPNSNFAEPQFSSLCGFIKCVPTEPYCAQPVQAVGQCCPHCGAMLRFRKSALNFTKAFAVVDQFIRAQLALPRGAGVSFVRLDRDDFHPLYQISVLSNHPANFDESEYCSIMWTVFRKIQQRTINDHLPIEYQPTDSAEFFDIRPKCSIQLGILHWKTVFKAIGFIVLVGIVLGLMTYSYYRHSPSFRLFVHELLSRQHRTIQVTWRRTHERVEMIRKENEEEKVDGNGGGGASFLAEFANRAFSWKMEKKDDDDDNEAKEKAAVIHSDKALAEEKGQQDK